jgi:hypothetical protein
MLQAHYNGPLGFSVQGATNSMKIAVNSGADAAAGGIINSANAVAAGVIQAGKMLPSIAAATAAGPCGLVRDPSIQQGASFASKAPSVWAQGTSKAVAAGTGICNVAHQPTSCSMPIQTAGWARTPATVSPPTPGVTVTATPPALPPGSIQWQDSRTGQWIYAAPKGSALGLATIEALNGALGAQGFISPWLKPSRYTSPYAVPPGLYKKTLWRRQFNWFDVNTADNPYHSTWGVGESHTVVGSGSTPDPTAKTVTEKEGKAATTPVYKKWWFWTAIGLAAAAGVGAVVYTRRYA